ncbi:hypothetical protein [Amycolatopsis thailandensis]|nr:hypothetical protein [Amycolatopsis thailandensis]
MEDQLKIVYETMSTAGRDIETTAAGIGQSAQDQLTRMQNIIGAGWGDANAEQMGQQFAMMAKRTGYHVDGMNANGQGYHNVRHIGESHEAHVNNIVNG